MARKTDPSSTAPLTVAAFAALMLVVIAYLVSVTMRGAGPTDTRASKPMTLTAGDDVLSLETDLRMLKKDTTVSEENSLQ